MRRESSLIVAVEHGQSGWTNTTKVGTAVDGRIGLSAGQLLGASACAPGLAC
jgi:hypothetical protein